MADRQRRSHQEIWATFERLRPKILGVLIDAVAHGLRALPTTQLDEMPRMADFAIWATACEGALWPKGTFMSAYMENRDEAVENQSRPMSWRLPCGYSWPSGRHGRERPPSWTECCVSSPATLKTPRLARGTSDPLDQAPEPRTVAVQARHHGDLRQDRSRSKARHHPFCIKGQSRSPDPRVVVCFDRWRTGRWVDIEITGGIRNATCEAKAPADAADVADAANSELPASASEKHAVAVETLAPAQGAQK